jgi:hypothetical protein
MVHKLSKRKDRSGRRAAPTAERWQAAQAVEAQAIVLADDLALLFEWMRTDVLGLAGESPEARAVLYDFIVQELAQRQNLCPHRLRPLVKTLRNHRQVLLGSVRALEERLVDLAPDLQVPLAELWNLCRLEALDRNRPLYWQRRAEAIRRLGPAWPVVQVAVQEALRQTPRASSMVENLNGRLRCYFYLWRQASRPYLQLLRFYLNHRRYARSAHTDRVGKSPYELLTGRTHPFWLDLLDASEPVLHN